MKPETIIQNKIMLALSSAGATMWRNAVAYAWVGKVIHKTDTEVTLSGAYPIQAGLCVGSSDLIGLKTITVTADMVGHQIAVFTAVEVKTKTGKASPEQKQFIDAVRKKGGIAGVARSVDDALQLIDGYPGQEKSD